MIGSVQVDWTQVIIVGVPAILSAIFAGIAMVKSSGTRRAIRTPSGDPIGHVVERAHETGIANNLLLRKMNGATKPAEAGALHEADTGPPHVPAE